MIHNPFHLMVGLYTLIQHLLWMSYGYLFYELRKRYHFLYRISNSFYLTSAKLNKRLRTQLAHKRGLHAYMSLIFYAYEYHFIIYINRTMYAFQIAIYLLCMYLYPYLQIRLQSLIGKAFHKCLFYLQQD